MEITVAKDGKQWDVIIQQGDEVQTAIFKTEAEAEAYKAFMEKLNVKKTKTKKTTRLQASIQAFKELNTEGFTLKQLAKKADELYLKDGGKSNPREQENNAKYVLIVIKDLGKDYIIPEINMSALYGEVVSIEENK